MDTFCNIFDTAMGTGSEDEDDEKQKDDEDSGSRKIRLWDPVEENDEGYLSG